MKVVSPKQMMQIEADAYRGGSSESDFMEEAGSGVALFVHELVEKHDLNRQVTLLCGKGNNAGDAYVAGIHLLHLDYEVLALQLSPLEECSHLCKQNYHRFLMEGGRIAHADSPTLPSFLQTGVIVDGIFGTGFHGPIKDPIYRAAILQANDSALPIIAIDIPSGLNGETGEVLGEAIQATETVFLGLPKTGFFLQDGWNHVGKLRYVDFGLPGTYIEKSAEELIMLSPDIISPLIPKIKRTRDKYERGQVVGLAGSPGMPGAALLSSLASLRGGAGIVRLLYPAGMHHELVASPYELIKVPYHYDDPQAILHVMNHAAATFIGPGMGRSTETIQLLKNILPHLEKPCVIDAEALTLIAQEDIPLPSCPTVLTPHLQELLRLLKHPETDNRSRELLKICENYAKKNRTTLLLKGGPTFIFSPEALTCVNPTGTPGMATAGSGDVLTGLIAALLAQKLSPHEAACLGVYLHGIAGEHAAEEYSPHAMIASDIITYFPEAYRLKEF
ncbi:NAD(P)H-hydrate dehydratase [Parachlamydia sp. AcF125]|uniref:NAD(P)H-hydrate dehydratase n=1 Tax=Parachlamydia sp. AcF125 TaxID=2795736 RepID=UPI001BC9C43C|nr:NAD(P)H-hydrate dehydratase [Parachlamydia sp. AcF125]MBS4168184.1 Bifunctional NAD(P)H-hydrate repair enzyme Nnr [Parachlamydia sp. AcF125]